MPMPNCDICKKPALGVASSPLGPISCAYCEECLAAHREPWFVLVGGLWGCQRGDVDDWVKLVIEATCSFYGKTEDDLWKEIAELDAEYEHARGAVEPIETVDQQIKSVAVDKITIGSADFYLEQEEEEEPEE